MTSTTLPSACPLDCPDSCSLEVQVTNGRITTIRGDGRNPLTAQVICSKVRDFGEVIYGEARLRHPMRRVGPKGSGEFEIISWDEALERVAEGLSEVRARFGGDAILPYCYGGSNGHFTQSSADSRLWSRLGACHLLRTYCAAPSSAATRGLYGRMPGTPLLHYEHSRLIVVWGNNPHASGIHLLPVIQRARKRGARLVVIDPRRTKLAQQADLHLPIRPGTDLPVALGILNWLFTQGHADEQFLATHATGVDELRRRVAPWTLERAAAEAGLPVASLERLVEWYVETSPAVIRCGWGVERNRHGGSAVAAIIAIPAVAGKFGVKGGGFTMSNSGAWRLDPSAAMQAEEPAGAPRRTVNMIHLGRALTELDNPKIAALFVYNANPWATAPLQSRVQEGLLRDDLFTVVFEQTMTDTARYADIILPATTFFEHEELSASYGTTVLQHARPVIEPVGEARSNFEVFTELADRLGLLREGDVRIVAELRERMLAPLANGAQVARALDEKGIAFTELGGESIPFVDHFPQTPDGKVHLVPRALDEQAPGGLYRFAREVPEATPLQLISPAHEKTVSSTGGATLEGRPPLQMHPEDAQGRGLRDGDLVRVFNGLGEVHATLSVTPRVRPGVVALPKGLWSRHTHNGYTSNVLIPDHLADLGGGGCYNDAWVEVQGLL